MSFGPSLELSSIRNKTDHQLAAYINNPVALWTGRNGFSSHNYAFTLAQGSGSSGVTLVGDSSAPLGWAFVFDGTDDFLRIPSASTGALNIQGNNVTVCAWVKRDTFKNVQFVAGVWNEVGGRKYGLFLELPDYGGNGAVCGHVSKDGLATAGYPYNIDYSSMRRHVTRSEWVFIAFTFNGSQSIAYDGGVADEWLNYTDSLPATYDKNPYNYVNSLNPASDDFTVGANNVSGSWSNFFIGRIGMLAVYDSALTGRELRLIANATKPGRDFINIAFDRDSTVGDGKTSTVGWKSYRTASCTDTTESAATTYNFQVSIFNQDGGGLLSYMTRRTPNTEVGFGCSDNALFVLPSEIDKITFEMNNANTADVLRVCLKIGSSWYASETTFSMAASGATATNWATAETKTLTMSLAGSAWRDLTVTPGVSLALAGAVRSTPIPDELVTGIGFFSPGITGSNRFKNIRVQSF